MRWFLLIGMILLGMALGYADFAIAAGILGGLILWSMGTSAKDSNIASKPVSQSPPPLEVPKPTDGVEMQAPVSATNSTPPPECSPAGMAQLWQEVRVLRQEVAVLRRAVADLQTGTPVDDAAPLAPVSTAIKAAMVQSETQISVPVAGEPSQPPPVFEVPPAAKPAVAVPVVAAAEVPRQSAPPMAASVPAPAPDVPQADTTGEVRIKTRTKPHTVAIKIAKPAAPNAVQRLWAWFWQGNVLLKVGLVVLFLGLAFLLRFASEHIDTPLWLRYCGVAAGGMALSGIGWWLRLRRRDYGLMLQGFGIAVMYLTTLSALKLHPLLPGELAFGLMVLLVLLMIALALLQDAPVLAQTGIIGGMAAPLLVSDGSGQYLVLFSYLALLNSGIALIAGFKAWRSLNLIGFIGTFAIGAMWGAGAYTPAHFATTEPFLLFHGVLYTLIACLFARQRLRQGNAVQAALPNHAALADLWAGMRQRLAQVGVLDNTLLFGVAVSAFTLQYAMVSSWPYGAAYSALGFAAFYALLALWVRRGGRMEWAVLGQAFAVLALLFATLAVPLAFEQSWTAAAWSVEAALVYAFGVRLRLPLSRLMALPVLWLAALNHVATLEWGGAVLLQGSVFGTVLLLLSAAVMYGCYRYWYEPDTAMWERNGLASVLLLALLAGWLLPMQLMAEPWPVLALLAAVMYALAIGLARPWVRAVAMAAYAVPLLHHLSLLRLGETTVLAGSLPQVLALVLAGAVMYALSRRWRSLLPMKWVEEGAIVLLLLALLHVALLPPLLLAKPQAMLWLVCWGIALAFAWRRWPELRLAWLVPVVVLGAWLMPQARAEWMMSDTLLHWAFFISAWLALPAAWALQGGFRLSENTEMPDKAAPYTGLMSGWVVLVAAGVVAYGAGTQVWPQWLWGYHSQLLWLPLLWFGVLLVLARPLHWASARQFTLALLPVAAWVLTVGWAWQIWQGSGLLPYGEAWLSWLLAVAAWAALHLWILRCQHRDLARQWLQWWHGIGFYLLLAALSWLVGNHQHTGNAAVWWYLGWLWVPLLLVLCLGSARLQARWPLADFAAVYVRWGGLVSAVALLLALLNLNWQHPGTAPWPYVPLLNVWDGANVLALWALWRWWRRSPWAHTVLARNQGAGGWLWPMALLCLLLSAAVMRTWHFYAGVDWRLPDLLASFGLQASLSVVWALSAIVLMVSGHRRHQREAWFAGSGLMGVVVLKLFLVELGNSGGIARIVSFIVVGLLLLLVGYFAPMPPKAEDKPED